MSGFLMTMCRVALIFTLWLAGASSALGLDQLSFQRDGKKMHVAGKILVTAQDGGMLLMAPDGVLWAIKPDELIDHTTTPAPFKPLGAEQLSEQLLEELPSGFRVYRTAHYLICYNTSEAYAQWCGSLYERLYRAFTNFWTNQGLDLKDPQFPLVAIVFKDRESYLNHTKKELGESATLINGFYSLRTNRVTMYDLTGLDAGGNGRRRLSAAQINQLLLRSEVVRNVVTIIHEATHQIAFNCGLLTRYADIPLWLSEGIAVYFETPDLKNVRGWRKIGSVNRMRLVQFRAFARNRPQDSLKTLISSDKRLKNPKQADDAYAEAWAINYHLIRSRKKDYTKYLKMLSKKTPLIKDDPETRLKEFRQVFGHDLESLDKKMLRHILR